MEDSYFLHLKNSILFFNNLKSGGLTYSYDEISDKESYANYLRLLENIEKFDKIPIQDNFLPLAPSVIFDISMTILKEIFGNIINNKLIDDLKNKIIVTGQNDVYIGAVVIGSDSTEKKLLFNRLDTSTSIPVFTHEATHYLFDDTKIFTNIHTTEILSILMEFIAADVIQEKKIDDITQNATFVARIEDMKVVREIRTKCYPYYEIYYCNDKDALNMIRIFAEHISYKSNYSFIIAYNLYLMYKENKKTFIREVRNLTYNENHINTLLDYYEINLNQDKCVDNAINLIRSLK